MFARLPVLLIAVSIVMLLPRVAWAQWTTPVPITTGSQDDIHPAVSNTAGSYLDGIEWLAFVRVAASGSKICLKKTLAGSSAWEDSVYAMTDDALVNDYPQLARVNNHIMLVWQRGSAGSDIFYSYNFGGGWSIPLALTSDGAGNRSPHIAAYDTSFIVVWEKNGRVLSSRSVGGTWMPPAFVTPAGDTSNSSPRVAGRNYVGKPVAVWEKQKPSSTTRAVLYSVCNDSGWTAPDTIAWTGDNRRPRSAKLSFHTGLVCFSYESNRSGDWEIYAAYGYFVTNEWEWGEKSLNVSENPSADDVEGSFLSIPIITGKTATPMWLQLMTAGTWRITSGTSDSILASSAHGPPCYLSGGAGSTDRNPDISSGVYYGGWVRVWSIWENNASGHWHLYGSRTDIVLGVDEYATLPRQVSLDQNYPNPFNPSTTIGYHLSGSSFVTITVFDVLGQQVATLVNEKQQAGYHTVEFRGSGLPSGAYLCRLQAGNVVQTRKVLLLK